ncbi:hypothetical protein D9M68_498710 [compost metagenome]
MVQRVAVDLQHQARRNHQGVAAQLHRGRPGMRLLAGNNDVVPALAERALHRADGDPPGLQDGPLLDVRLEIGAHGARRRRLGAGIADGAQRFVHTDAVAVARGQCVLEREGAGVHARPHHHGHEARAFLVGPHHHFQRRLGNDAALLQRAQDLDAGEHAVVAVELAPGGLGIDMAAGHDGGQIVAQARPAHEDIADGVHAHAAAQLAGPAADQIAPLPVQVGQRQPAHAALVGAADAGQFHQGRPQAVPVDTDAADSLQCIHFHGSSLGLRRPRPDSGLSRFRPP